MVRIRHGRPCSFILRFSLNVVIGTSVRIKFILWVTRPSVNISIVSVSYKPFGASTIDGSCVLQLDTFVRLFDCIALTNSRTEDGRRIEIIMRKKNKSCCSRWKGEL
jgi:hypothetical protein